MEEGGASVSGEYREEPLNKVSEKDVTGVSKVGVIGTLLFWLKIPAESNPGERGTPVGWGKTNALAWSGGMMACPSVDTAVPFETTWF